MRQVRVTWETDGESPDLPEEVEIPEALEEEGISDFLSDTYGWLVLGWERILSPIRTQVVGLRGADIFIEGFGTCGMADGKGQVASFELYEGKWVLHVWADINKENATHRIDLSGALESKRIP